MFLKKALEASFLAGIRLLPRAWVRHGLFLLKSHPELGDRWGYHLRPIHYYEPLPDFQRIQPEQALRDRTFPGIDVNLSAQVELLKHLGTCYRPELEQLAELPEPEGFDFQNDYFAALDASLYYALIRELKPARIVEVGSGYSTRMAAHALKQNAIAGHAGKLICIEPYPEPRLTDANLAIELIQQRVEDVDLSLFTSLDKMTFF